MDYGYEREGDAQRIAGSTARRVGELLGNARMATHWLLEAVEALPKRDDCHDSATYIRRALESLRGQT